MFGYDLGIDLGTNNVVITVPNKGVVVNEPSYVAYDTETEKCCTQAGVRTIFRAESLTELRLFSRLKTALSVLMP